MEAEAKYYVPEINEFFVGFEFERKNTLNKTKWVKATFKNGECAEQYCDEEDGRVKYLDSEDIESLGGVKISDYEYNINGAILQINCSDSTHITILEIGQEWEMTAVPSKTAEYYFPLFMGKIKNKSELKQVLKMIGVH